MTSNTKSNNKIFTNIMNTNNNNSNKSKQKSILDYFNKNNQLKRSSDCDNSLTNKSLKTKDNIILTIDENKVADNSVITDESLAKTNDILKDISNEEFIDLNQFLEIDFTVEDNETNVSPNDGSTPQEVESKDTNYLNESYVYHNFRQMIDFVLSDKQLCLLFDANDSKIIESFTCLSGLTQRLFMRLFMRKRNWIRKDSMKYLEISDNLTQMLEELVENGFLFNATHLSDLTESLDILNVKEMKRIGRSLNGLNMIGLNTKKNISAAIVKHTKTSQTVFKGDNASDSVSEVVLKSIRSDLKAKCFKVNEEKSVVFERMFLLFCEPEMNDEDLNHHLSFEFFKILRVESGEEVYPKYTIERNAQIYKSRDDLVRFYEAFKLEIEILSAIEKKDLEEVVNSLMNRAKRLYFDAIEGKADAIDGLLPTFLRRYTCGHSLIRCLSQCVSVLEKKKCYSEAVYMLKNILLKQTTYCQDWRGRWFERLAVNLDKHLKEPQNSLEAIELALKDDLVRTGHRFALYIRRKNIQKSLKISVSLLNEFECIRYPETTIFAETIKYSINNRKNIFKTTDSNGDVIVMPVEDIVLNHYQNNGFGCGLHTESSVYHTLLGLLFWDIIYMSDGSNVCDSFRFRFQRLPLDFNFDQFFVRRNTQILSLLNTLRHLTQTEVNNILENSWNTNFGTVSLINWQRVDINQIKEICDCLGSSVVLDICERLIRDFRHTRSGFPDLLVWNPSTHQIKAVEVKGPNDKASHKQQLWLSFLKSIGVDVEICHVKVRNSSFLTPE